MNTQSQLMSATRSGGSHTIPVQVGERGGEEEGRKRGKGLEWGGKEEVEKGMKK